MSPLLRFDIPLPLYQVVLYTVLFVGIGAMGAGVGYIVSYLFHEYREPPQDEPKALPSGKRPALPPGTADEAPSQASGEREHEQDSEQAGKQGGEQVGEPVRGAQDEGGPRDQQREAPRAPPQA